MRRSGLGGRRKPRGGLLTEAKGGGIKQEVGQKCCWVLHVSTGLGNRDAVGDPC